MSYYSSNNPNHNNNSNPLTFPYYSNQPLNHRLSISSLSGSGLPEKSSSLTSRTQLPLPQTRSGSISGEPTISADTNTSSTVPSRGSVPTTANNTTTTTGATTGATSSATNTSSANTTPSTIAGSSNNSSTTKENSRNTDPKSSSNLNHRNLESDSSNPVNASSMTSRSEVNPSTNVGDATHPNTITKKIRKNRPGQKFGAKKKSWVWSWFIQDSQNHNVAACNLCGKIITRLESDKGSPKKLSEHLKTHKIEKENTDGVSYDSDGKSLDNHSSLSKDTTQPANAIQPQGQLSHQGSNSPIQSFPQAQSLTHFGGVGATAGSVGGIGGVNGVGATIGATTGAGSANNSHQFNPHLQAQLPLHQHHHSQHHHMNHNPSNASSNGPGVSSLTNPNHSHNPTTGTGTSTTAAPGTGPGSNTVLTPSSTQAVQNLVGQVPLSNLNDMRNRNNDPSLHFQYNNVNNNSTTNNNNNNNRRFVSPHFDNSPYSAMKFHRHLLRFLTENKLSINVIKSHSFQQLIYDLKSDSVMELQELTGLYNSLLEVSRFDSSNMGSIEETNMVNTFAQAVNQKNNDPNN